MQKKLTQERKGLDRKEFNYRVIPGNCFSSSDGKEIEESDGKCVYFD